MDDNDDRVIPYEEAVRRRKAREEAAHRRGVIREVKMSDALEHLLEGKKAPEERPRPRLVEAPGRRPLGQLCHFETGVCDDPEDPPEESPPD